MVNQKIFFVGYNKTGTTSISKFLRLNGFKTIHSPLWTECYVKKNHPKCYQTDYTMHDKYQVFSDGEPSANLISYLYDRYPTALFILNTRPLKNWLESRVKAVMSSFPKYADGCIGREYLSNRKNALGVWIDRRNCYYKFLFEKFRDDKNFFVFCIEDDNWQEQLSNIIGFKHRTTNIHINKAIIRNDIHKKWIDRLKNELEEVLNEKEVKKEDYYNKGVINCKITEIDPNLWSVPTSTDINCKVINQEISDFIRLNKNSGLSNTRFLEFRKPLSPIKTESKVIETHVLIDHINHSLEKANNYNSKIDDGILSLDGMSGSKTRHFYNNICSMDNCRYLEIGTFKGSSICSALYKNTIKAVAIDNFQMSINKADSDRLYDICIKNINTVKGDNDILFLRENCWELDINKIIDHKFNVYMYDGNHEEISHFNALKRYLPCLDNIFIFIVDDWNVNTVRAGTNKAINDLDLITLHKIEIRLTYNNMHTPVNIAKNDFWNGMAVHLLKKRENNIPTKVQSNQNVLSGGGLEVDRRHYKFIEIGTSFFDTEIELANEDTFGISVEPIKRYLDKLPSPKNCIKVNCAITDYDGTIDIYYISPENIDKYKLGGGYGQNSVNKYHPVKSKQVISKGLKLEEVYTKENVPCMKISTLFEKYNVGSIKYLKIDTEGHDCTIMKSYLEYCETMPSLLADKIQFECNQLNCKKEVMDIVNNLKKLGYKVIKMDDDVVLTK